MEARRNGREAIYAPLTQSSREFRVLHILPGRKSQTVKSYLAVVSLYDRPNYEALSYVWGSQKSREPIRLCGRAVRVTTNLLDALKAVRLPDVERVMWIDALCINQEDFSERSQQVTLMGDIYRNAIKVIAWLGHDENDGRTAFEVIKVMSDFPDHHFDERMTPHLKSEILQPESIESLMRLLDGHWWKRVWTFQETALACQLEFRCGQYSLVGEKLAAAYENFWNHNDCCYSPFVGEYPGHPLSDLDKYFSRLARIYEFANLVEDIVFPAIMMVFRQRQCTDPRDKVFGYLGLAFGRFLNFIVPDYEKDTATVYEETALAIMEKIESLGPLSLLDGPRVKNIECPSWVPTWTAFPHDYIFEAYYMRMKWLITFNACRKKVAEQSLVCRGKLKVRGIVVHRVGRSGMVPDHHIIKHLTPIYDEWYALARCSGQSTYPDGRSTREQAFWLTLLNGSFHNEPGPLPQEDGEAGEYSPSLLAQDQTNRIDFPPEMSNDSPPSPKLDATDRQHWQKWWAFMHSPSDYLDTGSLWFNTCVTAATVNRSFFVTAVDVDNESAVNGDGSWMGTGPPDTRLDDLVVVLNGGLVPYILRPTGEQTKEQDGTLIPEFVILGDCYLHGIMHGEAIDQLDAGAYKEQNFVLV